MSKKQLPDEAYIALQALKDQARAVKANNFKGDKEALKNAQKNMSEVSSWTSAIVRKLMSNEDGHTIDDIDGKWLESQFM